MYEGIRAGDRSGGARAGLGVAMTHMEMLRRSGCEWNREETAGRVSCRILRGEGWKAGFSLLSSGSVLWASCRLPLVE